jgi:hypothetical protein
MDNNIIDALIYSNLKNNIPTTHFRYDKLLKSSNIKDTSLNIQQFKVNNFLTNSTIKRACCMAKNSNKANITPDGSGYLINVKIPIPPNYQPTDFEKKFKYKTIEVIVPKDLCRQKPIGVFDSNFNFEDNNFSECQNFYGAYCENMKYLYNLESGGVYFPDEFNKYISECSCLADLPKNAPSGVPNSCLLDNCSQNNADTVFLDYSSRAQQCESVFCQAITSVGNLQGSEGGQVNFDNKIQQTCGKEYRTNKDNSLLSNIDESNIDESNINKSNNLSNNTNLNNFDNNFNNNFNNNFDNSKNLDSNLSNTNLDSNLSNTNLDSNLSNTNLDTNSPNKNSNLDTNSNTNLDTNTNLDLDSNTNLKYIIIIVLFIICLLFSSLLGYIIFKYSKTKYSKTKNRK